MLMLRRTLLAAFAVLLFAVTANAGQMYVVLVPDPATFQTFLFDSKEA